MDPQTVCDFGLPTVGYSWKRALVGGLNPSEKYESQLGWLFSIYGKIKNVPNHQPVYDHYEIGGIEYTNLS